jgi:hypothetical protein
MYTHGLLWVNVKRLFNYTLTLGIHVLVINCGVN